MHGRFHGDTSQVLFSFKDKPVLEIFQTNKIVIMVVSTIWRVVFFCLFVFCNYWDGILLDRIQHLLKIQVSGFNVGHKI